MCRRRAAWDHLADRAPTAWFCGPNPGHVTFVLERGAGDEHRSRNLHAAAPRSLELAFQWVGRQVAGTLNLWWGKPRTFGRCPLAGLSPSAQRWREGHLESPRALPR